MKTRSRTNAYYSGPNRWILTLVGYETSPCPIDFLIHEMPSHNTSLNLLKNNPLYIEAIGFRE